MASYWQCSSASASASTSSDTKQRADAYMMTKRSQSIDADIARERQTLTLKMLLLGTAESGKSTILKQMRLIHSHGFTDAERHECRVAVFELVVDSMHTLTDQMRLLGVNYDDNRSVDRRHVAEVRRARRHVAGLNPMTVKAIKRLWSDGGIRQCFAMRAQFQIADSAIYFFEAIERIGTPGYMPSDEDLVHVRMPTTGAVEMKFVIRKIPFSVYDVGGQRTERRKWIHLFDNVHAIIYVCAVSEYDQTLFEDRTTNRLHESLNLFEEIINNRYFASTAVIMLWNKTDLFRAKLTSVPLTACFPTYAGDAHYATALGHIRSRFAHVNRRGAKGGVYAHETCAVDTKQIEKILASIVDVLIRNNLGQLGMS